MYAQFVSPFAAKFSAGFHVTIFAYGQTGTGKTYTMFGEDGERRGFVPRFIEEVMAAMPASADEGVGGMLGRTLGEEEATRARPLVVSTRHERVSVCVLEVYEGKAFDLLQPDLANPQLGAPLSLELQPSRADVDSRCYWVRGAAERTVRSVDEAMDALHESTRLRHTASHALNEHSSRSHCIFSVQIHRSREVHKLVQVVHHHHHHHHRHRHCHHHHHLHNHPPPR